MTNVPALGAVVLVTVDPGENNGSDTAAATIVRVWSDTIVNLKVHLDSTGEHPSSWLTSVKLHPTRADVEASGDISKGFDGPDRPFGAYWPPRV